MIQFLSIASHPVGRTGEWKPDELLAYSVDLGTSRSHRITQSSREMLFCDGVECLLNTIGKRLNQA